jgi:gluconokinase
MGRSPWFMGVDLGTGSCKTVVVDDRIRVLGFGVGNYAEGDLQDKWQEQDPERLLAGVVASVQKALTEAQVSPGNCAGLSLGGALHSLMALDGRGNPLTDVMTWADSRAVDQSRQVRGLPLATEIYRATGCPAHAMYPLYKIMWLRERRPEIFMQTSRFVSAKEYIFFRLTGSYMVDYCLAAGSGMLNTHTLSWNAPSLDLAGIREDQLSDLCPPLTVHKGLDPNLARQVGLPSGIPVVLGSGDAANSSLGAGAVSPWQATCMVGTSGALRVISPRPVLDAKARGWCYAVDESHWLVGGAINNGGVALSWFKGLVNQAFPHSPPNRQLSFDDVLDLAGQAETGAGGILCLPFFVGERSPNWNPNARAAFFGMTLEHNGTHLARALVEGIAFRLRSLREVLGDVGLDVRQMVASGGFTRSGFWLQVMADVLNRNLAVPKWGETSSLGAAFWAILAANPGKTLETLCSLVEVEGSHAPDPANAAVYDRIYPLYLKLYGALEGLFDQVAALQTGK